MPAPPPHASAQPIEQVKAIVDDALRGDYISGFHRNAQKWEAIVACVTHAASEGGEGETWTSALGGTEALKFIEAGPFRGVQRWRPHIHNSDDSDTSSSRDQGDLRGVAPAAVLVNEVSVAPPRLLDALKSTVVPEAAAATSPEYLREVASRCQMNDKISGFVLGHDLSWTPFLATITSTENGVWMADNGGTRAFPGGGEVYYDIRRWKPKETKPPKHQAVNRPTPRKKPREERNSPEDASPRKKTRPDADLDMIIGHTCPECGSIFPANTTCPFCPGNDSPQQTLFSQARPQARPQDARRTPKKQNEGAQHREVSEDGAAGPLRQLKINRHLNHILTWLSARRPQGPKVRSEFLSCARLLRKTHHYPSRLPPRLPPPMRRER